MRPVNDLADVRRLLADVRKFEAFDVVLRALRAWSLDSDDLKSIIGDELGETHCYKSELTKKYFPGTNSDYYSLWVDECNCRMFIKLLVVELGTPDERLVVTSFKKDNRYA